MEAGFSDLKKWDEMAHEMDVWAPQGMLQISSVWAQV